MSHHPSWMSIKYISTLNTLRSLRVNKSVYLALIQHFYTLFNCRDSFNAKFAKITLNILDLWNTISELFLMQPSYWSRKYSSILAWKTPWTEETDGVQSMVSQRVRHNWCAENAWACTQSSFFAAKIIKHLRTPQTYLILYFLIIWVGK